MSDVEKRRLYFRQRYQRRREAALSILGDICVKCGSENDIHIDHIDPYQKKFDLNTISNLSYERFVDELSKCQLLCKTCHINKTSIDGSYKKNKAKGERVNHAKLTEEDIRNIRLSSLSGAELGRQYGVSRHNISSIRRYRTWKHVK